MTLVFSYSYDNYCLLATDSRVKFPGPMYRQRRKMDYNLRNNSILKHNDDLISNSSVAGYYLCISGMYNDLVTSIFSQINHNYDKLLLAELLTNINGVNCEETIRNRINKENPSSRNEIRRLEHLMAIRKQVDKMTNSKISILRVYNQAPPDIVKIANGEVKVENITSHGSGILIPKVNELIFSSIPETLEDALERSKLIFEELYKDEDFRGYQIVTTEYDEESKNTKVSYAEDIDEDKMPHFSFRTH